jgi:hypothetical protein
MVTPSQTQLTIRPSDAETVVVYLLKGWMPESIARETGISVDVIKRIKAQSPELSSNEYVIANLQEIVSRGLDRVRTEMATMSLDKLALSCAIFIDKVQLLKGQATQRVEVRSVMSHKELIEKIEKLTNSKTVKEINDDCDTGKSGD